MKLLQQLEQKGLLGVKLQLSGVWTQEPVRNWGGTSLSAEAEPASSWIQVGSGSGFHVDKESSEISFLWTEASFAWKKSTEWEKRTLTALRFNLLFAVDNFAPPPAVTSTRLAPRAERNKRSDMSATSSRWVYRCSCGEIRILKFTFGFK